MKKIIIFLLFFCIGTLSLHSQKLKAFFDYNQFYSPVDKSFIETYISVDGSSVNWKKTDIHSKQAQVMVTILFYKDSNIVSYSKENLYSPELNDTANQRIHFMQVKRFPLDTGNYKMIIRMNDLNDTLKDALVYIPISVEFNNSKIEISGLEAIDSYQKSETPGVLTKGNLHLVPYIYTLYPASINTITFYAEVYNSLKYFGSAEEPLLFTYNIRNHENDQIIQNYNKYERRKAAEVLPCLIKFDISNLPTGSFDLVFEVRDKLNNVLSTKSYFFQRENSAIKLDFNDLVNVSVASSFIEPISNIDSLREFVRCLAPISSGIEKEFAERLAFEGDMKHLQQYILNFWQSRNSISPEKSFNDYLIEVAKVQNEFGGKYTKGYRTDRGRVYLQYGPPNSITKSYNEAGALPYEIWHYYNLRNQTNRKFVFYNPDLSIKHFELLHSDALGEVNNYQWRLYLRSHHPSFNSIDDTGENDDIWGNKYNEYYQNPR